MTHEQLKQYSESIGYTLNDEDCEDIIQTSYIGETVEQAVNDYLDAYER
jgi:hypothetical protein